MQAVKCLIYLELRIASRAISGFYPIFYSDQVGKCLGAGILYQQPGINYRPGKTTKKDQETTWCALIMTASRKAMFKKRQLRLIFFILHLLK